MKLFKNGVQKRKFKEEGSDEVKFLWHSSATAQKFYKFRFFLFEFAVWNLFLNNFMLNFFQKI